MDKTLILFCLVSAITVVLGVVSFIVSKLEKGIEEHGFYYKQVLRLNENYHFSQAQYHWIINHSVKSKKALERLNPDDIIIYYFENNINGFSDNFEKTIERIFW